jgi:hypothetical protein
MLGVEWPDTLPQRFAVEHGIGHLRDSGVPEIPSNLRLDIRRHAGESVAALKEQVFPIHRVAG